MANYLRVILIGEAYTNRKGFCDEIWLTGQMILQRKDGSYCSVNELQDINKRMTLDPGFYTLNLCHGTYALSPEEFDARTSKERIQTRAAKKREKLGRIIALLKTDHPDKPKLKRVIKGIQDDMAYIESRYIDPTLYPL